MTGSQYWYDARTSSTTPATAPVRHEALRAQDRDGGVVALSEVGRSERPDDRDDRDDLAAVAGETQPVGAVTPRYRAADPCPTTGLGPRVEKILYVAEQEAAETRRSATRESTALIERARDEAESLRYEGEQAARSLRADNERRAADLDERERRLEKERDGARADADRLLAEARREVDRLLADAAEQAEVSRAELDRELDDRRGELDREIEERRVLLDRELEDRRGALDLELADRRIELDRELEDRRDEVARQMGWLEESRQAARDLAHMLLEQAGEEVPAAPARGTAADVAPTPPAPPRHSVAVAPPLELRFAGTFGLPVLGDAEPGGVARLAARADDTARRFRVTDPEPPGDDRDARRATDRGADRATDWAADRGAAREAEWEADRSAEREADREPGGWFVERDTTQRLHTLSTGRASGLGSGHHAEGRTA